ncbi:MAG: DUF465 domain-containing protein [Gammaproteobacteria bacterium]
MFGEKHNLLDELPEFKNKIHEMKISNKHFSRLFDEYHELDHQVLRIEENIETTSDDFLDTLKKKRLLLKDELFGLLQTT